jgi:hypothetical protein
MTAPAQPARLTSDELAQALSHVLDTIGQIKGRALDFYGVLRQLQPCQIDVMHLYVRAVASGLLPRWIEPPDPADDEVRLLHAWATLAGVLPGLYPGEVIAIKRRAAEIRELPEGRYKVAMYEEDVPLLVEHAESVVRLMLTKRLTAPAPAPTTPIQIDHDNGVVHYAGDRFAVTPNQAQALQRLLDAKGGFVPAKLLRDSPNGGQRPDRWIRDLPPPLRGLIEAKTGAGFRLIIAPTRLFPRHASIRSAELTVD